MPFWSAKEMKSDTLTGRTNEMINLPYFDPHPLNDETEADSSYPSSRLRSVKLSSVDRYLKSN